MERVYFETTGKNIALKINGKMVIFGRNSHEPGQKDYTVNKIKSSLNHMLEYFYDTDEQFAKNFVTKLYNKMINTELRERAMIMKGDQHGVVIKKKLYIENCKLDDTTMFKIIDYIRATMDDIDTFDEYKGRSFRRIEVIVLNIISMHIKICFLMFLLHGTKKFDSFLEYNVFSVVGDACSGYSKYIDRVVNSPGVLDERDLEEAEYIENNDIFDSIYSYFSSYGSDKWNRGNEEKLKGMFYESGFDDAAIQNETFTKAIVSLTRYSIIPKSAEIVEKYFPNLSPAEVQQESYNVHTMEWSDFGFIHKNFTKYMESTLRNVVSGMQSRKIPMFINSTSIVSDDITQSRVEIYYEDKYSSLLPQKQEKALEVIDSTSKAVARYNYKKVTNNIKTSSILSKSLYNYFLDTMYGESHILRDIIGRYSSYPLTIVYIVLERFGTFPNICKALVSNVRSTGPQIEREFIRSEFAGLSMLTYAGELFVSAVSEILSVYEYKGVDVFENYVTIPIHELKNLLTTLQDSDKMYKEFYYIINGEYPIDILPENFINKTPDILYTPVIFPDDEKQKFIDEIHEGR